MPGLPQPERKRWQTARQSRCSQRTVATPGEWTTDGHGQWPAPGDCERTVAGDREWTTTAASDLCFLNGQLMAR